MLKLFTAFALCLAIAFSPMAFAQSLPIPAAVGALTPEQANLDMRVVRRALLALHPALTKYRTQADIDAAFAKFESRAAAARTPAEMYLAASELAAAIRCGHTWTNVLNQRGPIKAALLESANKLPFTMTFVEGRWLVLESADVAIQKGDEILAVNGIAAKDMVAMLMPYLRADGSSDNKRLVQLNHNRADFSQMDMLWPLLSSPVGGEYRVSVLRLDGATRTVNVAATTLAARKAALAKQEVTGVDTTWKFRIDNNVGVLTLPTFAFWNSKFDWAKFINESFAQLITKDVANLVIDIRANEGGSGEIVGKIGSYLISEPYRYVSRQAVSAYERVPYNLVRYLDTWDYSFFDRTGQVEKITKGTAAGKWLVTSRANVTQIILPAPSRYQGKVFGLVGGENSSATFMFADLMQRSRAGTLVGQITGGNQRGLNGGEMTWVTMPNSGVAVDIPLLASTYEFDTPDASVRPEVIVKRSFEAQRAGRDEEMDAVMKLIAGRQ